MLDTSKLYTTMEYKDRAFTLVAQDGDRVTLTRNDTPDVTALVADLMLWSPRGEVDLTADLPQVFLHNGRELIAVYSGPCVSCSRRCYDLAATSPWRSDNSIFGDNANSCLVAKDDDMVGPDVPLCLVCANTGERHEAALAAARATTWKPKPPMIEVDLSAFKVPSMSWNNGGDGYDRMGVAEAMGWQAVSSWGRDGWDFLDWPYYIGYIRDAAEGFELATDCEGDIDWYRFPTREARTEAMDRLAFWHWQCRETSWVEGIHPDEIPDHLRGPFSSDRHA